MSRIVPFSQVDLVLNEFKEDQLLGCIIDTNILIAASYDLHPFNQAKYTIRQQKIMLDREIARGQFAVLSDAKIKVCKEKFFPEKKFGKDGWLKICNFYLNSRLPQAWKKAVDVFGINHLDLRKESTQDLILEKIEWDNMCKLSEKSGLGISDAMIINILKCSKIPFLVSADYDAAYAFAFEETDKILFVPDNLYRNKVKKILEQ